ncbi:MAG: flippase-like domain-containing protein [Methanocellales archaeon]
MVEVTLVLPAYNEASRIENAVEAISRELREITDSFEIIIAEDGSTDGTDKIASELAKRFDYVKHLHSKERLGRGRALARAFSSGKGAILVYLDVDLATDVKHLKELIQAIREGYDIATGSRLLNQSEVKRPFKREIASKGYNLLVRLLLSSKLRDHQCGFKAFKRESFEKLSNQVKAHHWFWDTECLIRAQRAGFKVKEFPVKWCHGGDTKVKLSRDILGMGSRVLALWWEFNRGRIKTLLAFALALFILYFIANLLNVSREALFEALAKLNYSFLFLALSMYLISWPLRGLRYQQILGRTGNQLDLNFLTGVIFLSQSANVVLPARIGDLTRAYLLKAKRSIALTTGFSSLAVERIFDVIAITLTGCIALAILIEEIVLLPELVFAFLIASLFIFLFLLFIFLFKLFKTKFSNSSDSNIRSSNIRSHLIRFLNEIQSVSVNPKSFFSILIFSLAIWCIDAFTCYFILSGLNSTPTLSLVFLAVTLGNLVKVIPLTPGGIGTYEGTLAIIFKLGGIPGSLGFIAAFLDHLIKNAATLAFGLLYLLKLELSFEELVGKRV